MAVRDLFRRIAAGLLPLGALAIVVETVVAMAIYPALREHLGAHPILIALRLWTTSSPILVVAAALTAVVTTLCSRRWQPARAAATAGVLVASVGAGTLVYFLLGEAFPRGLPRDTSALAALAGALALMLAAACVGGLLAYALVKTPARGAPLRFAVVASWVLFVGGVVGWIAPAGVKVPAPPELFPDTGVGSQPLAGNSVVLITVDTLRATHMSLYGYGRSTTPNLDAWAANHAVFDNAVATRTYTAPAVASIMTGLYPELHGVGRHPSRLAGALSTMAELFSEADYDTAAFVTNPAITNRDFNYHQGFDEWHPQPDTARAEDVIAESARYVTERSDAKNAFFLWVHLMDPHTPYLPPRPYDQMFAHDAIYGELADLRLEPASATRTRLWDLWGGRAASSQLATRDLLGPEWGQLGLSQAQLRSADYFVSQYDGEIAYLDEHVGAFLEQLGRDLPDALVLFTADHGESMAEHEYLFSHGKYAYEPTAHIPLVIAHRAFGPARIAVPVSGVDVLPTLTELLGLRAPVALEGTSLVRYLAQHSAPLPADVRAVRVGARNTATYPVQGLRAGAWKLILTPARLALPLDALFPRQLRLPADDARQLPPHLFRSYSTELYHLAADAGEERNLAVARPDVAEELRRRLWQEMQRQQAKRLVLGELDQSTVAIDEETLQRLRALGYVE